jgi:glutamine---fructose-6-phosphate transaminase (isomerizing)
MRVLPTQYAASTRPIALPPGAPTTVKTIISTGVPVHQDSWRATPPSPLRLGGTPHPHGKDADYAQLKAEILEQPTRMRDLAASFPQQFALLPKPNGQPKELVFMGEGSSFNALNATKPYVALMTNLPVSVNLPAQVEDLKHSLSHPAWQPTQAHHAQAFEQAMVAALSQSGKSSSVLNALNALQPRQLVPITNTPDSPLGTGYGVAPLVLKAGEERSIAATKSYSNSMLAALLTGWHLGNQLQPGRNTPQLREHLETTPDRLAPFLNDPQVHTQLQQAAKHLAPHHQLLLMSSGPLADVLPEAALKLCETTSTLTQAHRTEGFKHGPKVVMDHAPATVYVLPPATTQANTLATLDDMQEHLRGTRNPDKARHNTLILRYENSPQLTPDTLKHLHLKPSQVVTLPSSDQLNSPTDQLFLGATTFQLLSLYLAEAKGVSPNHPGLQKAVIATQPSSPA